MFETLLPTRPITCAYQKYMRDSNQQHIVIGGPGKCCWRLPSVRMTAQGVLTVVYAPKNISYKGLIYASPDQNPRTCLLWLPMPSVTFGPISTVA